MSNSTVTNRELANVNRLARLYMRGEDARLDEVVDYLELCISEDERRSVRYWWNEGVRDYADGEDHRREVVQLLEERWHAREGQRRE